MNKSRVLRIATSVAVIAGLGFVVGRNISPRPGEATGFNHDYNHTTR